MAAHPCCLDAGFGRPLQTRLKVMMQKVHVASVKISGYELSRFKVELTLILWGGGCFNLVLVYLTDLVWYGWTKRQSQTVSVNDLTVH